MTTNRLAELMAERGLNQERLAALTGLDQSHISRLIRSKSVPSLNTAAKVAKALGVSIETIWTVTEAAS